MNPLLRCSSPIRTTGAADGGSEEDSTRAQAGPGQSGRRAGLRSTISVEKDRAVGVGGEETVKKVGNTRKSLEKRLGR